MCMHPGMCRLWPESGHWAEITLHQHQPVTIIIPEALDACLLRGSQSSPHGGGLPHPPHQDPGSPEPQSDQRWEV